MAKAKETLKLMNEFATIKVARDTLVTILQTLAAQDVKTCSECKEFPDDEACKTQPPDCGEILKAAAGPSGVVDVTNMWPKSVAVTGATKPTTSHEATVVIKKGETVHPTIPTMEDAPPFFTQKAWRGMVAGAVLGTLVAIFAAAAAVWYVNKKGWLAKQGGLPSTGNVETPGKDGVEMTGIGVGENPMNRALTPGRKAAGQETDMEGGSGSGKAKTVRVRIEGLKTAELNGCEGWRGDWIAARGRWEVHLDNGRSVQIKPENIRIRQDGAGAGGDGKKGADKVEMVAL